MNSITQTIVVLAFFLIGNNGFTQRNQIGSAKLITIDTALIQENGIHALTVYQDISEDGLIDSEYTVSAKTSEYAFNDAGLTTFQRTNSGEHMISIIGGRSGERVEITYDSHYRATRYCSYRESYDFCMNYTYDEDGNILTTETGNPDEMTRRTTFVWKNGKMVNGSDERLDDMKLSGITTYDEKGRILETKHPNSIFRNAYSETANTETTISTVYRKDSLERQYVYVRKKNSHLLVYKLELDGANDTITEFKATYDDSGNILTAIEVDHSERRRAALMYPPVIENGDGEIITLKEEIPTARVFTYRFINHYDERGLLIRRDTYLKDSDMKNEILQSIERFIYEKAPLIIQPLKEREEELYYDEY